jgi:Tol biopolymer transport system component
MRIERSARLGAYEIVDVVGVGGMGEVYSARDLKLHRSLAIKVLPDMAAGDPERRDRFEREAQAIAALNHPNIVTIYSIEEGKSPSARDGRCTFLTMELVIGRPLSECIPASGMPLGRLLTIALAVVEGVAAAHQKGVTHRDLKPANIMLGEGEHAGRIKILDFGLAKLTGGVLSTDGATALPTAALTGQGVVLGTVAYMSPEQAEGKSIDARSDLFSIGVILYEMATGRRPFSGDTPISIISSIVKDTPKPLTDINTTLPRELERVVRRALAKDPERRYQTAKDLRNDLEDLKASLDSGALAMDAASAARAGARRSPGRWTAAALALSAGLLGLASYVALRPRPASVAGRPPVQMVSLTSTGTARSPAISPDGQYVAYVEASGSDQSVWLQQIAGSSRLRIVAPTPGMAVLGLTITPDSRFVDVVRRVGENPPQLWRVPFFGGEPRVIVDGTWSAPGWSPDGRQMAYLSQTGLVVAGADGSHPREIAGRTTPRRFLSLSYVMRHDLRPVWLADGKSIAVLGNDDTRGYTALQIFTVDVATGAMSQIDLPESREMMPGLGMARGPDGRSLLLTYITDGGPPQIVRVGPNGALTPMTSDVSQYAGLDSAGDVAVTSDRALKSSLWITDGAGGSPRQLEHDVASEVGRGGVAWSGDRLIYPASLPGGSGLWSKDTGATPAQLIVPGATTPTTSADGRTLIFMRGVGKLSLWRSGPEGRNAAEIPGATGYSPQLTPDGSTLFYVSGQTGRQQAFVVDVKSGGTPRQFSPVFVTSWGVQVSPDGRLVALLQGVGAGGREIDIVPTEGGEPVRRLAISGFRIQWTADGRGLSYIDPGTLSNIWVQPTAGGLPRQLTSFPDRRISSYAWSPDGKSIAIARTLETSDIVLLKGLQ